MQVTILVVAGDPFVHRAGCAHLKRLEGQRTGTRYDMEASSAEAVANDFWTDLIASGEMTAEEALGYVEFAPCTKELWK